jgi:hypothetical protein
MVDTPSLIIGIIAIVIALIAIVFVFVRKGNQGAQGNQGSQGIIGPTGPDGDLPGVTGEKGPTGPPFSAGETGPAGPAGKMGNTGPTGIEGVMGPDGVQGDTGQQGGFFVLNKRVSITDDSTIFNLDDVNNKYITFVKTKNTSNNLVVLGNRDDPLNTIKVFGSSFLLNNFTPDPIQYCTICSRGSNACNKDGKCLSGEIPIFTDSQGNAFSKILQSGYSYLHTLVNKGGNSAVYRSVSKIDLFPTNA